MAEATTVVAAKKPTVNFEKKFEKKIEEKTVKDSIYIWRNQQKDSEDKDYELKPNSLYKMYTNNVGNVISPDKTNENLKVGKTWKGNGKSIVRDTIYTIQREPWSGLTVKPENPPENPPENANFPHLNEIEYVKSVHISNDDLYIDKRLHDLLEDANRTKKSKPIKIKIMNIKSTQPIDARVVWLNHKENITPFPPPDGSRFLVGLDGTASKVGGQAGGLAGQAGGLAGALTGGLVGRKIMGGVGTLAGMALDKLYLDGQTLLVPNLEDFVFVPEAFSEPSLEKKFFLWCLMTNTPFAVGINPFTEKEKKEKEKKLDVIFKKWVTDGGGNNFVSKIRLLDTALLSWASVTDKLLTCSIAKPTFDINEIKEAALEDSNKLAKLFKEKQIKDTENMLLNAENLQQLAEDDSSVDHEDNKRKLLVQLKQLEEDGDEKGRDFLLRWQKVREMVLNNPDCSTPKKVDIMEDVIVFLKKKIVKLKEDKLSIEADTLGVVAKGMMVATLGLVGYYYGDKIKKSISDFGAKDNNEEISIGDSVTASMSKAKFKKIDVILNKVIANAKNDKATEVINAKDISGFDHNYTHNINETIFPIFPAAQDAQAVKKSKIKEYDISNEDYDLMAELSDPSIQEILKNGIESGIDDTWAETVSISKQKMNLYERSKNRGIEGTIGHNKSWPNNWTTALSPGSKTCSAIVRDDYWHNEGKVNNMNYAEANDQITASSPLFVASSEHFVTLYTRGVKKELIIVPKKQIAMSLYEMSQDFAEAIPIKTKTREGKPELSAPATYEKPFWPQPFDAAGMQAKAIELETHRSVWATFKGLTIPEVINIHRDFVPGQPVIMKYNFEEGEILKADSSKALSALQKDNLSKWLVSMCFDFEITSNDGIEKAKENLKRVSESVSNRLDTILTSALCVEGYTDGKLPTFYESTKGYSFLPKFISDDTKAKTETHWDTPPSATRWYITVQTSTGVKQFDLAVIGSYAGACQFLGAQRWECDVKKKMNGMFGRLAGGAKETKRNSLGIDIYKLLGSPMKKCVIDGRNVYTGVRVTNDGNTVHNDVTAMFNKNPILDTTQTLEPLKNALVETKDMFLEVSGKNIIISPSKQGIINATSILLKQCAVLQGSTAKMGAAGVIDEETAKWAMGLMSKFNFMDTAIEKDAEETKWADKYHALSTDGKDDKDPVKKQKLAMYRFYYNQHRIPRVMKTKMQEIFQKAELNEGATDEDKQKRDAFSRTQIHMERFWSSKNWEPVVEGEEDFIALENDVSKKEKEGRTVRAIDPRGAVAWVNGMPAYTEVVYFEKYGRKPDTGDAMDPVSLSSLVNQFSGLFASVKKDADNDLESHETWLESLTNMSALYYYTGPTGLVEVAFRASKKKNERGAEVWQILTRAGAFIDNIIPAQCKAMSMTEWGAIGIEWVWSLLPYTMRKTVWNAAVAKFKWAINFIRKMSTTSWLKLAGGFVAVLLSAVGFCYMFFPSLDPMSDRLVTKSYRYIGPKKWKKGNFEIWKNKLLKKLKTKGDYPDASPGASAREALVKESTAEESTAEQVMAIEAARKKMDDLEKDTVMAIEAEQKQTRIYVKAKHQLDDAEIDSKKPLLGKGPGRTKQRAARKKKEEAAKKKN